MGKKSRMMVLSLKSEEGGEPEPLGTLDSIQEQLADFAANTQHGDIPAEVRTRAVHHMLDAAGIAMASTNLLFALLAWTGKDYTLLAGAVFLDNLTAGLATSAFVAYLSSLCNRAFTATQYALLASTGNFARIQLGAVAGWTVDAMGGDWAAFFILTTVAALPGLLLLYFLMRRTNPGRIE